MPHTSAPHLPAPDLEFVPFTASDYETWLAQSIPAYALDHVQDGRWSPAEALERSREAHAALLPEGLATPGHIFMRLQERGDPRILGHLWWQELDAGGRRGLYVYGVEVAPGERRRGVASAAFVALEAHARRRGLGFVSLHVFGHNPDARRLYESLGYRPTNITMRKELP